MPRRRGKERDPMKQGGGRPGGPDPGASREPDPRTPDRHEKQRQSELAKQTPYGDYRDRRKTS